MAISRVFDRPAQDGFRARLLGLVGVLVLANLLMWAWAAAAFAARPVLMGMAVLAFTLGLRHALDADHIAAIDNVTRKQMQDGKRPIAVGLFFALGHSAVVLIASMAVAFTARSFAEQFAPYREIGGVLGTSMSALFLLVIAVANLGVLVAVVRALRQSQRGHVLRDEDIDAILMGRGFMVRLLAPVFRLVSKSWHLFPVGFLFALGFETASEVSLFGLAAGASSDVSGWTIMIFPLLFTAGMTLLDTVDGILMLGAYGWAYRGPERKLVYNLTVTSLSVLVAFVVGGIEVLGLIGQRLHLGNGFWDSVAGLNASFGVLGCGIVALFAVSWAASVALFYVRRRDRIGETV
ncbi:nickel transporter [Rhodopseudomonas sp. AAP120]|uniref:HoxN/HupN/NixA family nickel/cobalt transporter n=1 Tax=Rhodopseudomonas sp. AAP120 TaxID=1523430 RepID=UPI0006B99D03|nr:HoxN/HupN/NixA family nickel/cobalt transporter [Rhodopseudomonas sp. AAP120]KPF98225.1 nickel transporter [Rhodopseudomonas sp. AAP120]